KRRAWVRRRRHAEAEPSGRGVSVPPADEGKAGADASRRHVPRFETAVCGQTVREGTVGPRDRAEAALADGGTGEIQARYLQPDLAVDGPGALGQEDEHDRRRRARPRSQQG